MAQSQTSGADNRDEEKPSWKHWLEDRLTGALLSASRPLPYHWRIPIFGWIGSYVIGPLAGMRARIRANLELVAPELSEPEIRRICRQVPNNMARAMAETFTGDAFIERVAPSPVSGAGWEALQQARDHRRPIIMVTAHLGNYDVARVVLRKHGFSGASVYMPMQNKVFNTRYVAAMEHISAPVFPRNRAGLANTVRFLRDGGMIGLVVDHYMAHGTLIDFMGVPARTSTAPAQLALKHGALLVPLYAIREKDGLSFRIEVEAPIPHSDPLTMTRAINASLEKKVRAHMDQWMWTHKRWKRNQPR